jgi:hypothetical protein
LRVLCRPGIGDLEAAGGKGNWSGNAAFAAATHDAPARHSGRSSMDLQVHDSILQFLSAALEICKRNNRWMEGLVAAARPVAFVTKLNIETVDGVLSGTHS